MENKNYINDITSEEIKAGFISPQMIALEERYYNDSKFAKKMDRQAYIDLYDLLYTDQK